MKKTLAIIFFKVMLCFVKSFGTQLSLVERLLWEQDVGGSNPLVPTKQKTVRKGGFLFERRAQDLSLRQGGSTTSESQTEYGGQLKADERQCDEVNPLSGDQCGGAQPSL